MCHKVKQANGINILHRSFGGGCFLLVQKRTRESFISLMLSSLYPFHALSHSLLYRETFANRETHHFPSCMDILLLDCIEGEKPSACTLYKGVCTEH
mmetsp:Transcript_20165/g.40466  ORF Transcript_20165/g.40466 Transcript_20165/m.40466 type:complete len:97 (+) Transcript_20165:1596-1886(+)